MSAFAQTNSQTTMTIEPMAHTPTFHVTVVSRSVQAVNYKHRSGSTKLDFAGTDLMGSADGKAEVNSKRGSIEIEAEFGNLRKPTTFGNKYLTYVLWAISPEGRAMNLGEVLVGENHRSKLRVTTDLQAFALIVTAEPYYAVRQPSNLVVLENVVRDDTKGTTEAVNAKYELMERGGYIPTGYKFDPVVLNARLPLEFFEARNALRIAQSAGAEQYATESYRKAVRQMDEADSMAIRKHENKKSLIAVSREVVEKAEDAREISVKHIDEERLAHERRAGANREASANNRADDEAQRRAGAEADTAEAQRRRREADRNNLDAQSAAMQAAAAKAGAERDRDSAQRQQQAAEAESDRNRANAASSDAQLQQATGAKADAERDRNTAERDRNDAQQQRRAAEADSDRNRERAASSDAQLQQAVRDREDIRARLLTQFNLILETRDTARGLVVNMSDVLFDSGKYTLRPLAREKLAKISGIVLAYPTLRLAVE